MFRKRLLTTVFMIALLVVFFVPTAIAENDISVFINSQPLSLDVSPQVVNGRTLVPLRAIFEALGASVEWNAADQSITATKEGQVLTLTVGSSTALNNGTTVQLDTPPQIIDGRTLVPLRFVSENMGAEVGWDASTHQVSVVSQAAVNPQAATANMINPSKIDGIIRDSSRQFQKLTRIEKISPEIALSKQIELLKQQPEIDLVEQLPDSTNLKVRFKDGYELLMLQGDPENKGTTIPAVLTDSGIVRKPTANVVQQVMPEILKESGANLEILANASPEYDSLSPNGFKALIFDTTYDNINQMPGLDDYVAQKLYNTGYSVHKYQANAASLSAAANIDGAYQDGYALVYISGHGGVENGDFTFTVRPYYNSPPPTNSGYTGTKICSVYTGLQSGGYYDTAYVYAVGKQFAETYWTNKFPKTIFLMSACSSAQSSGLNSLPGWTLDHGASAWLGWTGSVSFKNSDNGTKEFINQITTQWKTVDEANNQVHSIINPKSPRMFLYIPTWDQVNVTMPHIKYDPKEEKYPYGYNFYNFKLEKFNEDAYLTFYTLNKSPEFYLCLDNNNDGKSDIRVKFTPGTYEVYSFDSGGQANLQQLGKTRVNDFLQYQAVIPWAVLFGTGNISSYRLVEGSAGTGDTMPDSGWLVAPSGYADPNVQDYPIPTTPTATNTDQTATGSNGTTTTPSSPTSLTTSSGGTGGTDTGSSGSTTTPSSPTSLTTTADGSSGKGTGSFGAVSSSDASLIAQYKFNGDFKDASGKGNDGIKEGDVAFADDAVMGKCAVFNGGFVNVKSIPELNLGEEFTISLWVKVDTANKVYPMISKLTDNGYYNIYNFFTRSTYGIEADISTTGGPGMVLKDGPFTDLHLDDGWSHLVLTRDGPTVYAYHNGAQIAKRDFYSKDEKMQSSTGNMRIGNGSDVNQKNLLFKGRMDDLRVYNRTLSAQEISGLYNGGKPSGN